MYNRRKGARIYLDEPLDMLITEPEQKNILIVIDEISYSGLRFKTNAELALHVEIAFKIPRLDPLETMRGIIVWKNQRNDGFLYGFEITRPENAYV